MCVFECKENCQIQFSPLLVMQACKHTAFTIHFMCNVGILNVQPTGKENRLSFVKMVCTRMRRLSNSRFMNIGVIACKLCGNSIVKIVATSKGWSKSSEFIVLFVDNTMVSMTWNLCAKFMVFIKKLMHITSTYVLIYLQKLRARKKYEIYPSCTAQFCNTAIFIQLT